MEAQQQIDRLAAEIRKHNDLYFNRAAPELSDDEFDDLVLQLKALDPDNPVLDEIGSEPGYGKKVKHPALMGSLAKVHSAKELVDWAKKFPPGTKFVVSPKMDGCAVRLEFKDGKLAVGATRGNGEEGMDVTANIEAMGVTVPQNYSGEIRGEIYMDKSDFATLNGELKMKGEKEMANPRNAAAGGLNQKDPAVTGGRKLKLASYGIVCPAQPGLQSETEVMKYVLAHTFSFKYVPLMPIDLFDIDEVEELLSKAEQKRQGMPHNIDGLVFSVDSLAAQEAAGWTGRCPNGKIAYKFRPEQAKAIVTGIEFQVGRTGRITPVLKFTPTALDGSTVKQCTLHNIARLRKLAVGAGDEVVIYKGGDIIPEADRVSKKAEGGTPYPAPENCPVCGSTLQMDDNDISLWCRNSLCSAQMEGRILNFIQIAEMKGIGPSTVAGLCSKGLVKEFADLYQVSVSDVATVTGGTRAAEIVVEAIKAKRKLPLHVFLDALGVHLLGTTMSKALAKGRTLEDIRKMTVGDMRSVEGAGPGKAQSIVSGLAVLGQALDRLLKVVEIEVPKAVVGGALTGKTFLITGTLSAPRKAVEAKIEAAGGTMVGSVSKKLNFLVVGDDPGSKVDKAKAAGVPVIDEKELERMITG